ncbi:hypothetical protein GHJ82_24410 [Sinorhizobium saheli]|nr:hypothetical protein [Sinorhizobium saheli]
MIGFLYSVMALLLGQFPLGGKLRSKAVRRESGASSLGIQKSQGEGKRGKNKASPQLRARQPDRLLNG